MFSSAVVVPAAGPATSRASAAPARLEGAGPTFGDYLEPPAPTDEDAATPDPLALAPAPGIDAPVEPEPAATPGVDAAATLLPPQAPPRVSAATVTADIDLKAAAADVAPADTSLPLQTPPASSAVAASTPAAPPVAATTAAAPAPAATPGAAGPPGPGDAPPPEPDPEPDRVAAPASAPASTPGAIAVEGRAAAPLQAQAPFALALAEAGAPHAAWRLAAQPSRETPDAAPPGHVAPRDVAGQITLAIGEAKHGHVEIRLDPPELGRVQIRLNPTEGGGLQAVVLADRPETQDFLRRNADALARDLNSAGYAQVSLEFASGHEAPRRDAPAETRRSDAFDPAPGPIAPAAAAPPSALPGGLDIRL